MKFFCEYCGCNIDANKDLKCPNCGAMYNKNRTYLKMIEEKEKEQQNNKKQGKKISIVVLAMFILIPILGIATFLIISLKAMNNTKDVANDTFNNVFNSIIDEDEMSKSKDVIQSEIDILNKDISSLDQTNNDLQSEIDSLNSELASIKAEEHQEFMSNSFSEKYYTLENQINKLQDSVREKEITLSKNKRLIEEKKDEINKLQEELNKAN